MALRAGERREQDLMPWEVAGSSRTTTLDPLAELLTAWDGEACSAAEITAFLRISRAVPAA